MKIRKLFTLALALMVSGALAAQVKRIGIIGLDTSHAIAFTKVINDDTGKYPAMEGYRVTVAYPQGSTTIQSSYDRIPKYTEDIQKYGVKIVSSLAELLDQVDYVMLETNDGKVHLEQAVQVFKAGKPVFIDKPIAASLPDAIAIFELAKKYKVPVFSSSSLRYTPETQKIAQEQKGKVFAAFSYGPEKKEPSHMAYAWYGIHGIEALFTVMGTGCQQVTCTVAESAETVTGVWEGGRIGTFLGTATGKSLYGGTAFTAKGAMPFGSKVPYDVLTGEFIKFFKTGVPPVSAEETIEIFTFMAAADISKSKGGVPVKMADVYKQNHAKALQILKKY